jgi:hypothetical protein
VTEIPDYYDQKKPSSSNKKMRVCMMCRKKFMSESTGHRFCDKCKTTSEYKGGHSTYKVRM